MQLKKLLFFAFITSITFSACSDDKDYQEEARQFVLTGVSPLIAEEGNSSANLPISWSPYDWNYEGDRLVSYSPKFAANVKTVEVTKNTASIFEATGSYKATNATEVTISTVKLENGLVKNQEEINGSDQMHFYSINHNYNYNEEGYLESVSGTAKNGFVTMDTQINITWENGNIAKIEVQDNDMFVTYKYTYDDKAYIPMSDLRHILLSLYIARILLPSLVPS